MLPADKEKKVKLCGPADQVSDGECLDATMKCVVTCKSA